MCFTTIRCAFIKPFKQHEAISMTESSSDKLNQLYSEMLVLLQKEEKMRQETEKLLAKAKKMIDPRNEFNKWLKSSEGKDWKKKQFEYQNGKCASCGETLRFADAEVHHVLSLKEGGKTANKPENFKLLHPNCNRKIGSKFVNLD
ncbi:conserved protein of unknown function [Limnospira indica PCC 8005]|uniref:HNH nuclease domain-containing protein n=2 Tax=Limnospira TaxID=2596745 RepID=A0A9P1KJ69_9CYAN|nr:conserved protein of unknown function [Limnospira indica PCC 8005]